MLFLPKRACHVTVLILALHNCDLVSMAMASGHCWGLDYGSYLVLPSSLLGRIYQLLFIGGN